MPLLRGHHLVCLHFYDGEGYDDAFIKNLEDTLRSAEGDEIEISAGADDVCAACLHLKGGSCMQADNADEAIRKMDSRALALLGHSVYDTVGWNVLRDKISGIFPEWYSLYCKGCGWRKACEQNSFFRENYDNRR